MTLAKTCHASNMKQDLLKATYRPTQPQKLSESSVSMFHYCIEKN